MSWFETNPTLRVLLSFWIVQLLLFFMRHLGAYILSCDLTVKHKEHFGTTGGLQLKMNE